jgi:hypothetical protein
MNVAAEHVGKNSLWAAAAGASSYSHMELRWPLQAAAPAAHAWLLLSI